MNKVVYLWGMGNGVKYLVYGLLCFLGFAGCMFAYETLPDEYGKDPAWLIVAYVFYMNALIFIIAHGAIKRDNKKAEDPHPEHTMD